MRTVASHSLVSLDGMEFVVVLSSRYFGSRYFNDLRATRMEDMLLLRPPPRTLLERGAPASFEMLYDGARK